MNEAAPVAVTVDLCGVVDAIAAGARNQTLIHAILFALETETTPLGTVHRIRDACDAQGWTLLPLRSLVTAS